MTEKLAGVVRDEREARGWSRQALARRAGVDRRTVAALEHDADLALRSVTAVLAALDLRLHVTDLGSKDTWAADPEVLRWRRRALRLTQAAAARRAGLSPVYLSRLEAGRQQPRLGALRAAAAALDLALVCRRTKVPCTSAGERDTVRAAEGSE